MIRLNHLLIINTILAVVISLTSHLLMDGWKNFMALIFSEHQNVSESEADLSAIPLYCRFLILHPIVVYLLPAFCLIVSLLRIDLSLRIYLQIYGMLAFVFSFFTLISLLFAPDVDSFLHNLKSA